MTQKKWVVTLWQSIYLHLTLSLEPAGISTPLATIPDNYREKQFYGVTGLSCINPAPRLGCWRASSAALLPRRWRKYFSHHFHVASVSRNKAFAGTYSYAVFHPLASRLQGVCGNMSSADRRLIYWRDDSPGLGHRKAVYMSTPEADRRKALTGMLLLKQYTELEEKL